MMSHQATKMVEEQQELQQPYRQCESDDSDYENVEACEEMDGEQCAGEKPQNVTAELVRSVMDASFNHSFDTECSGLVEGQIAEFKRQVGQCMAENAEMAEKMENFERKRSDDSAKLWEQIALLKDQTKNAESGQNAKLRADFQNLVEKVAAFKKCSEEKDACIKLQKERLDSFESEVVQMMTFMEEREQEMAAMNHKLEDASRLVTERNAENAVLNDKLQGLEAIVRCLQEEKDQQSVRGIAENTTAAGNGTRGRIQFAMLENRWKEQVGGQIVEDGYGFKKDAANSSGAISICYVRAKVPFCYKAAKVAGVPDDRHALFYFEVDIRDRDCEIKIGFGDDKLCFTSGGYFMSDLNKQQPYGRRFGRGDTVGVGLILPPANTDGQRPLLFRTVNGAVGKHISLPCNATSLCARVYAVGGGNNAMEVSANFGQKPFKYNPEGHQLPPAQ